MDPGLRRDDGTNAIGAVSSGAGAQLVEADRGVRLQARSSLARQLQCPCCWKNALKLSWIATWNPMIILKTAVILRNDAPGRTQPTVRRMAGRPFRRSAMPQSASAQARGSTRNAQTRRVAMPHCAPARSFESHQKRALARPPQREVPPPCPLLWRPPSAPAAILHSTQNNAICNR